ncbi:hypothetical protein PVAP13_3NG183609 [Panicum virgatum]|uniref:Uncharacterized protein n=1 Tax=Panicum virgatum TaxID=38727 RepID=A0A8T0U4C8_PANVG|nr:hypothetical protein PVAP13_3NG183609 [Panicum virgatum]KAG2617779.1 hypothetical protein PVAP13_3NG183609 [Panicum virgatum]KAG2617780.1 hypothetical protein PVAP13_3NG183609 [Panicum virgatum]
MTPLVSRSAKIAYISWTYVRKKQTLFQWPSLQTMACGGLYLVDSMNNGVRGCSPKGINHLPEYDRHDHHRHAVAQRPNQADQHQPDIGAVRVLEQPMERHLGHRHVLLAILLLFFITLHYISSSCRGAFFCHAARALCQVLAYCIWLLLLC